MSRSYQNDVPAPPESKYYRPPADVRKDFAKRLASKLRESGMTQSELARRASHIAGRPIGRDLVSNYVRGRFAPRPETLAPIAKALKCQVCDLLPPGSVPSVDQPDSPQLSMQTLNENAVWLRINMVLPFETAVKVLEIVNKTAK